MIGCCCKYCDVSPGPGQAGHLQSPINFPFVGPGTGCHIRPISIVLSLVTPPPAISSHNNILSYPFYLKPIAGRRGGGEIDGWTRGNCLDLCLPRTIRINWLHSPPIFVRCWTLASLPLLLLLLLLDTDYRG